MARRGLLKDKVVPLLTLLLVIAITVGIFLYRDRVVGLRQYGYLGAFLISLVCNATVILPVGNILLLATLGAVLPSPTLVGLAGGLGAAIGEISGYVVGYTGHGVVERNRMYNRVEDWVRRWGGIIIFFLAVFPFFFDLVGIAAGVLRFRFWKFFLLSWLGRTLLYVGVAWAAALGWEAMLRCLG